MSHKEKCKQYCKEFLQGLLLIQYYTDAKFEHVYRKQNGANGNAWVIGSNAADFIISNSKFLQNESGNKTEA